ncbi:MAG: AAA family ATPase [bacterium]
MPKLDINPQFKKALDLMEKTDKSVFITGKAGTGKSTLLNYFCDNSEKSTVILAPTGVAAVNIGGQTIHSFFNFKPNVTTDEAKKSAKKILGRCGDVFDNLDMIIIDEISMVRADLMDCIDVCLKTIYKNKKPFGGLQMVFFGDLYQLPPVLTGNDKEIFSKHYDSCYFFDAKIMKDFQMEFIELEKIYRQKDSGFIETLNSIRNNTTEDRHLELINSRFCGDIDTDDLEDGYIYLTTTNKMADKINKLNLDKLSEEEIVLTGEISGDFDSKYLPTDVELSLKVGAQVMLLKNDSKGRWVNGTVGKIVEFDDENEVVVVKLSSGWDVCVKPERWDIYETKFNKKTKKLEKNTLGFFVQYPIKLAWAITVHKSQGKTFDKVVIDLSGGVFACGQTYVALSRCRSLDGIILKKPVKKSQILVDWKIAKFMTSYQYKISEQICSREDKEQIILQAAKEKRKIRIVYLKAKDQKSEREILPKKIEEMEYLGKKFIGLKAYCYLRKEDRVFKVERILEILE